MRRGRRASGIGHRGLPALALLVLLPRAAWAHAGRGLQPHDLARAWTFDPAVIATLVVSALLYGRGVRRLWDGAGVGRGVRRREVGCFAIGWLVLVAALVSPLHAMGDVLFSAHMVQHELLITVAAPLLVLGRPLVPMLWGLPPAWRRGAGRAARTPAVHGAWHWLTGASVAFLLHAAALWLWHAPGLYQATLTSDAMHAAQHVSFLATGLLFWWVAFGRGRPAPRPGAQASARTRAAQGMGAAMLFGTALHTTALGALITFATSLWYPAYGATTAPWGLMPLEDQQLAGLIMWIPGGVAYVVAALSLFAGWMRGAEEDAAPLMRPAGAAAAPASLELVEGR